MTTLDREAAGLDRWAGAIAALASVGLCCGGGLLARPAMAQSAAGGALAESAPVAAAGRDSIARRLHEIARSEQATGHQEVAQRLLEQLVARYPEAAVTPQARRDLFMIYAKDRDIASASPPPAAATASSTPPLPQPAALAAPPDVAERAGGWRTSMFARATLQDDVRSVIGDRVFFSTGSSEIGSRARSVLTAQAEWLGRNLDVDVVVEGHADAAELGGEDDTLARDRAEQVRFRLVAEGVVPERVRVISYGTKAPVATCSDPDCAAQNRRAVIRIEPRGQSVAAPATPGASRGPN